MKKDLIGEITKRRIGCYRVDQETLKKPFEWPRAVSRNFCTSCGTLVEIGPDYARLLLNYALEPHPKMEELKNFYLESDGCGACKKKSSKTAIKPIL